MTIHPVNEHPGDPPASSRRSNARTVLVEGLAVTLAGALFALAANAISPHGLKLTRDYFPSAAPRSAPPSSVPRDVPASSAANTNRGAVTALEPLAARLKERGLQLIESNRVFALFRDPRYDQELVVFIDARNDAEYEQGHVPGAYPLDRYHPEKYMGTVLAVCQTAEQIVVYCNGGDCEDSEFTAITLAGAGLPASNLWVYAGGFSEWAATNGWPVEVGSRRSGNLLPRAK